MLEKVKVSEFNYCLKVENEYIIYNTLYGGIMTLTDQEYQSFFSLDASAFGAEQSCLFEQGFWVSEDTNERESYEKFAKHFAHLLNKDMMGLTILPTLKCNARCFYCFEHGVKQTEMCKDVAKKIMEFVCSQGIKKVNIEWFGGEPMVNAEMIQYLCDWFLIKNISFSSNMVSNGFLLQSPEIIKNAKKFWKLKTVQISLDGLHDVYRSRKKYVEDCKDPFSHVIHNIHLLSEQGIKVSIRLNIDKENLDEILRLSEYLAQEFHENPYIHVYGEFIHDESGKNEQVFIDIEERKQVMEKLMPILIRSKLYDFHEMFKRMPKLNACMYDHEHAFVIDPEGIIYKCENECGRIGYQIGSILDQNSINNTLRRGLPERKIYDECSSCSLYPLCFGGCQYHQKIGIKPCFLDRYTIDILLRYLYEENKKVKA